MQRDEAFRPLSREHLAALLAAKSLREATDPEAAGREFIEFWSEHGQRHFRVEEEVLLPTWDAYGQIDTGGVRRMLAEHLEIRREAVRLTAGECSLADLHALGALLHDHVRFEERELFAAAEESLSVDALGRLAEAIEQAERQIQSVPERPHLFDRRFSSSRFLYFYTRCVEIREEEGAG